MCLSHRDTSVAWQMLTLTMGMMIGRLWTFPSLGLERSAGSGARPSQEPMPLCGLQTTSSALPRLGLSKSNLCQVVWPHGVECYLALEDSLFLNHTSVIALCALYLLRHRVWGMGGGKPKYDILWQGGGWGYGMTNYDVWQWQDMGIMVKFRHETHKKGEVLALKTKIPLSYCEFG